MQVTLYSNKCPNCRMLEAMLKQKGIVFQENNDISVIVDKGFKSIPYLAVDDVFMDFYKAKEWVMNYKN